MKWKYKTKNFQKLISVLESTEKFPQYLYDIPGGSSYGLQLLSRRLRMKLEMASSQTGNADPNKQQQLIERWGEEENNCVFFSKMKKIWAFWSSELLKASVEFFCILNSSRERIHFAFQNTCYSSKMLLIKGDINTWSHSYQKEIGELKFHDKYSRTGKLIKSEPLATVGQIKSAVLKMVARQWYERERHSYAFVKAIQEATANPAQSLKFIYTSDFDDQGMQLKRN